ncbi:MAG: hypoxanthine phosphoribosyltransferase [Actinomycetota bacterium]|jgi:hypoxanthine phosphoribosyltransferase|nr:hypoxanthine phosphoribosyltransferase [Actinomycetota bacterium]
MELDSSTSASWADFDPALGEILLTSTQIQEKISKLGDIIAKDYRNRSLLMVGVLKGALFFIADLARAVNLPVEVDFMAVSSYGVTTKTSGVVRIVKDLDLDLTGKDVLIVEDVVDSGLTLSYLVRNLRARNASSVEVCALLVKDGMQPDGLEVAYTGFVIPRVFVVGYGLDLAERYRNLPHIAVYKG